MTEQATQTNQGGSRWGIHDEVVQLREWGARRPLVLPPPPAMVTLGASPACTFRLDDPSVSREHLQLSYADGRWLGVDRDSKNGTRLDGVRTKTFALTPGCEVRAGGVTLFAESRRWMELAQFLRRILGYAEDRAEAVDHALRSVRQAALGRGALYMSGAGDLVHVALSLHRFVWGANRPFIMCDPRRVETDESVRSVANKTTSMEALAAARRGTLCIRAARPPQDLGESLALLEQPGPRTLLVVVDAEPGLRLLTDENTNPSIDIPSLSRRIDELPTVIEEYVTDAARTLSLPRSLFMDEDRQWIREHSAASLPDIEKAAQRLLALRGSRNFSLAATRLQMATVSLTRWFGRRSLPASLAAKMRASSDQ